jgi:hypothetical protein
VRRGLLLVVLLLVLALVWWLWPSGGDDTTGTAAESTPTPTPSVSDSSSPSPEPSKTKKKPKPEPELEPECADSAIEVTVDADAESYPADRQPAFTFTVENVSEEACSRDVGQSANELRVTSGGAQVWSSDDCNPGGSADPTNLDPGDRFVQTVSWPKELSAEGCPTPQESAEPGTYQVIARNLEVLSEPAVFVLE